MAETLRDGLRVSDFAGSDRLAAPGTFRITDDPQAALANADIVLVTVKSLDTAAMAQSLRQLAPTARALSLQNGIGNTDVLRAAGLKVVAGMVPFNIVVTGNRFHRATGGEILVGDEDVAKALAVSGLPMQSHPDMAGAQWAKLLLNLNNALNALSGLPLLTQLSDRKWRRVMALQSAEALAVLRAAGIKPARLGRVPPAIVPYVLQLPNGLFGAVARQMLAIDPTARLSMYEDLLRGRPTEIDYLQGAIVALARRHTVAAPMSERVIALVKQAEAAQQDSPMLRPEQIL